MVFECTCLCRSLAAVSFWLALQQMYCCRSTFDNFSQIGPNRSSFLVSMVFPFKWQLTIKIQFRWRCKRSPSAPKTRFHSDETNTADDGVEAWKPQTKKNHHEMEIRVAIENVCTLIRIFIVFNLIWRGCARSRCIAMLKITNAWQVQGQKANSKPIEIALWRLFAVSSWSNILQYWNEPASSRSLCRWVEQARCSLKKRADRLDR